MSEFSIFLNWLTLRARAQPDTPQGNAVSTELSRLGARLEAQGQRFEPPLTDREKEITKLLVRKMQKEHTTHTVLA